MKEVTTRCDGCGVVLPGVQSRMPKMDLCNPCLDKLIEMHFRPGMFKPQPEPEKLPEGWVMGRRGPRQLGVYDG